MILNLDRAVFGLMYRIGFTPWDGHQLALRLRELVEGDAALPVGKALDVGCGTGDTSIYLSRHGWDVTGVDFVERALEKARLKGQRAGVSVRWLRADVTRLGQHDVGRGFSLVVDNGLLHGLSDDARDAYVREITPLVVDGGRLLIVGFGPGKRRGPRGIDREEVERHFDGGWELLATGIDPAASNLADDPLYFYDLRRSGSGVT
ncbi:MAG TPA: class I SAM-dependent methyltransferase [Longimicrobiaceae bacterium]|nr:class I SAM-dependent methyltransferase [Longimicrobiaceae bacterium]